MGIGRRVRTIRQQNGKTQQELARLAGLGVSYLSRLENGRVAPSTRTVAKISAALGISTASLFDSTEALEPGEQCPVSLSGNCILELPFTTVGRQTSHPEAYTKDHLRVLRSVNFLLHKGSQEARTTLMHTVKALLLAHDVADEDIPVIKPTSQSDK